MGNVNAASFPLEFVEQVEGKRRIVQLELSPMSDKDISELDNWVQSKYIRTARNAANELSPEQYEREIEIAQRTAAGLSAFSGLGARMIASVDGMARVVWQSAKKNNPNITEERIRQLLFNPENLKEANEKFKQANLSDAPISDKGQKGGRTQKQKERQKRFLRQVKE